jgi:hypothetical protein
MNFAQQHDIGAYLGSAPGIASTAQTAGANAAINGKTFDRRAQSDRFHSVMIVGQLQATLASGKTASVALKLQDSANDSDWTDYGTALAATQSHDAAGGAITALSNTVHHSVDLATARRYIRMVVTPSMSATDTDTCVATGVMVMGGADAIPVATPTAL